MKRHYKYLVAGEERTGLDSTVMGRAKAHTISGAIRIAKGFKELGWKVRIITVRKGDKL